MIKIFKTITAFLAVLAVLILGAAIGLATVIGAAIMKLAGLGLFIVGGIAVVINEWLHDRKQRKALRDRTIDQ